MTLLVQPMTPPWLDPRKRRQSRYGRLDRGAIGMDGFTGAAWLWHASGGQTH
jgi:hypothetical protein